VFVYVTVNSWIRFTTFSIKAIVLSAIFSSYKEDYCPTFPAANMNMTLFKRNSMKTVRHCQQFFNFELPSAAIISRAVKFAYSFYV